MFLRTTRRRSFSVLKEETVPCTRKPQRKPNFYLIDGAKADYIKHQAEYMRVLHNGFCCIVHMCETTCKPNFATNRKKMSRKIV